MTVPTVPAVSLEVLAQANKPAQLALLEQLAARFTAAPAVTDLLVRGSLATGTADRLSDVDLVIGVHDAHLPAMLDTLDDLMRTAFGTVLPGWRDTIVADLGGAGSVHLIPHDGHLHQADLYLAPTSAVDALRERTGARPVFHRAPDPVPGPGEVRAARARIASERAAPASCAALLTEAVVLHAMLRKRLTRAQAFIAYGLHHQMHCTLRDLVKTALVPHSRHHGWYHLPDEIGASPLGAWCLAELAAAVDTPAVPTPRQADTALDRIWNVAERVAPHAADALREPLATYRLYQEPHA